MQVVKHQDLEARLSRKKAKLNPILTKKLIACGGIKSQSFKVGVTLCLHKPLTQEFLFLIKARTQRQCRAGVNRMVTPLNFQS